MGRPGNRGMGRPKPYGNDQQMMPQMSSYPNNIPGMGSMSQMPQFQDSGNYPGYPYPSYGDTLKPMLDQIPGGWGDTLKPYIDTYGKYVMFPDGKGGYITNPAAYPRNSLDY